MKTVTPKDTHACAVVKVFPGKYKLVRHVRCLQKLVLYAELLPVGVILPISRRLGEVTGHDQRKHIQRIFKHILPMNNGAPSARPLGK